MKMCNYTSPQSTTQSRDQVIPKTTLTFSSFNYNETQLRYIKHRLQFNLHQLWSYWEYNLAQYIPDTIYKTCGNLQISLTYSANGNKAHPDDINLLFLVLIFSFSYLTECAGFTCIGVNKKKSIKDTTNMDKVRSSVNRAQHKTEEIRKL